jgi:hypothetical protein
MSVGNAIIELQQRKVTPMNILSLKINVFNGTNTISPVYEVHSWAKAEEIILATQELIKNNPHASFDFEVFGNSTSNLW